jgi:leucyl/phenylalanyl-tRNA--protein transferase
MFDAQLQNPHLERFGSYIVSDKEYQLLLRKALKHQGNFS